MRLSGDSATLQLAFAGACAAASLYCFAQGAWPFGAVEAIWAIAAGRRWWLLAKF